MRPPRNSAPRVRVIASNLHVGGGVQAAASLIDEIARLQHNDMSSTLSGITYEVSSAVWNNLRLETRQSDRIERRRRRPTTVRYWPSDLVRSYDVSLLVFGPAYFPLRARVKIMGYADGTSLYADVPGLPPRSRGWRRRRTDLRRRWSLAAARRSDVLVVETEAVKRRVQQTIGVSNGQVRVIPNVVNTLALQGGRQLSTEVSRADPLERVLLYTSRAYPHKNLGFLPALRREALNRYGVPLRFLVTLTDAEWSAQPDDFREACLNLGELSVEQLAAAHRLADGVIFPSLLESFSVTPIEALALGTPLFASDRDFVRSLCHDAALYFDPLDAASAAAEIVAGFEDTQGLEWRREEGLRLARGLVTAEERARMYVALMDEQLDALARARAPEISEDAPWTT